MNAEVHKQAILIVDDYEAEVELMSIAIEAMNLPYRIDAARHGVDALDYLYRRGKHAGRPAGRPVLMMLDNKMPLMNGVEAAKIIRGDAAFQALPIVMFTSSALAEDIAAAYAAGVNSYVVKPVASNQYAEVTRSIVDYWTAVNSGLDSSLPVSAQA